jgi:ATP/maltotriose-dependent transcriptional regulator MalT
MYHGGALLIVDDPVTAERVLRPVTETLQGMGERRMFSTAVALLAESLFRLGEHEQAMLATMLSEDSTAADDSASQMLWRSVRAKVLAIRGELEEADRLILEALTIADKTDFVNMIGDAHLDAAFVYRATGKPTEASTAAREALACYTRKENRASCRRARRFIDALVLA